MLKIWKMAADFQNVHRYNACLCSSVVLVEVLEHNCNPAGENELSFVVGTCVFFYLHDSGFQRASALSYTVHGKKNVDADCCFPDEMRMLQQSKEEMVPFFSKKQLFKSSDKTSSTTGSSAAIFLVDIYPDLGPLEFETSDQMIRFKLFRFLSVKMCSSFCPEKKNFRKFHSNGKPSRVTFNLTQ